MRILICATAITRGSGFSQYIINIASEFKKSGDEIGIVTTHCSDQQFENDLSAQIGVKCVYQFNKYSKIAKYYKLWRFINAWKPDIIINNFNAPLQIILPLLYRRNRLIHVLHCDDRIYYRVAALNANWVKNWVAPSKAVAKHFSEYTNHKYDNRIIVIPHGVAPNPSEKGDRKRTILELTFIGVIDQHKGAQNLPAIIKEIEKKYNFHFTIIGEGGMKDRLEYDLKDQISKGLVTFAGVIDNQNVYAHLAKTDIFVFPTHFESFGLVLVEAMINGAVPITTHIEGVTDSIIANGVDGYLVEQDSIKEFVDKISLLFENHELLETMSVAAKRKAEKEFTTSKMVEMYKQYFD